MQEVEYPHWKLEKGHSEEVPFMRRHHLPVITNTSQPFRNKNNPQRKLLVSLQEKQTPRPYYGGKTTLHQVDHVSTILEIRPVPDLGYNDPDRGEETIKKGKT